MKKIHILLPLLAILLSCWSNPALAQDEQNRVVIIKKTIDENGVETIEKTIKEGDDTNVFVWSNDNGEEMSFDLDGGDGDETIHIRMKGDNGEENYSFESIGENMEELKAKLKELDLFLVVLRKLRGYKKETSLQLSTVNRQSVLMTLVMPSVLRKSEMLLMFLTSAMEISSKLQPL